MEAVGRSELGHSKDRRERLSQRPRPTEPVGAAAVDEFRNWKRKGRALDSCARPFLRPDESGSGLISDGSGNGGGMGNAAGRSGHG